jgi:hypothetical protein
MTMENIFSHRFFHYEIANLQKIIELLGIGYGKFDKRCEKNNKRQDAIPAPKSCLSKAN